MRKSLTAILLLWMGLHNVAAQENSNFHFRKIQVDDGLSENTVYCILQDTKGFMWFGTKDGLNCYDGSDFRVFRNDTENPNSLGNNFVRSITDSEEGFFYIGTDNGMYIMDHATETFSSFDIMTDSGETVYTTVNALVRDRNGMVWIGTSQQGIFRYNPADNSLCKIAVKGYDLGANAVLCITQDQSGTVWAGTTIGLLRFNPTLSHFDTVEGLFAMVNNSDYEILSIQEDVKGNLWLGSWSKGLILLNRQTGKITSYMDDKDKGIYITHVRSIFQYDASSLLVGSDDGLYLFNALDKTYSRVDITALGSNMSDQNIYSIFRDREDGIWIGTYFGGINYLNTSLLATEYYYPYGMQHSLKGKAISQFCEDPSGNMWVATEDGGVNYFYVQTKSFTQPVRTSYHNTHALMFDGDDLWIGTFSRGIDIYNTKSGGITNFRSVANDLATLNDDCIFMLYKTGNGDIYAGTRIGLNKYNRETKSFTHIYEAYGFIYDMKEDYRGNLWIASYGNGVIKYDAAADEWIRYDAVFPHTNPIVRSKMTSIYIDSQRRLWFTSEGDGIFLYDYGTDSFSNISESDGLPNNVVYGILDDRYGNLWISCNRGIVCFSPEDPGNFTVYGKEDGMQSNQFNYKSSYKASDGKFYFGGVNGFNCFYPDELSESRVLKTAPVEISRFSLLGKSTPELENAIRTGVNTGSPIKLPYNKSSFTITYVGLNFVSQARNQYAHRLSGVDRGWNYVGSNRQVTYINLPPGKYVFQVKASNNNIWGDEVASIAIEILPPVWLTRAAKILYGLIIIGLIALLVKYYTDRSYEKQKRQLDVFKAEQENLAFKSKIDFFTRIAHEIRTPLNLIKAPLEEIMNTEIESDANKENLIIIDRNCDRLSVLIKQLLDFRKLDSVTYVVNPEKADIREQLSALHHRFYKTAHGRSINFELIMPEEMSRPEVVTDIDAFIKIVGNLLTNALKFTKDSIKIKLKENDNGTYTISVEDNGAGIPDEIKDLVFDPFYQIKTSEENIGSGIGLSLVKHLADILNSSVEIEDNPSGGTIFHFTLSEIELPEPVSEMPIETDIQPTAARPKEDRQQILLVDDNEDILRFIKHSLSALYDIDTATSAGTAIKMVDMKFYSLIISDIMMPAIDGIEFVKSIRSDVKYSHIPIILLSAKSENSVKIEGLRAGANTFIEKPFSMLYLRAQITSLLQNRKSILEMFNKSPLASYSILATNKRDREFLNKLNSEIDKHLSDMDFSIESITDIFLISRSNLQRKIKSLCDMTPGDYLKDYRLRRACQLLLEGNKRINEVAYEVGFNSVSYFTKCFVRHYGMLPKEFLKKNLDNT